MARRNYLDCRDYPSVSGCSVRISGTADEIVPIAVEHAVRVHAHKKSPALAREIRSLLKDEPAGRRPAKKQTKKTVVARLGRSARSRVLHPLERVQR
jgi:hypothetical protein